MGIYRSMDCPTKVKVEFRKQELERDAALEMPLIKEVGERLRCENDAHVIPALVELGASHVPVVMHVDDSCLVDSYQGILWKRVHVLLVALDAQVASKRGLAAFVTIPRS